MKIALLMLIEYQSIDRVRPSSQCGVRTMPPEIVVAFSGFKVGIALDGGGNARLRICVVRVRRRGDVELRWLAGEQFGDEQEREVIDKAVAQLAQADIVVDLAGQAEFPGFDRAAGGIVGDAARGVEVERLDDIVLRSGAFTSTKPSSTLYAPENWAKLPPPHAGIAPI